MGKAFKKGTDHIQVLSLAGGGFMGLFTANVLAKIEEQEKRHFFDTTELFAGTSIGSLIALGLASGKKASEIEKKMREAGPDIFPSSVFPIISKFPIFSKVKNLWKPKFDEKRLRSAIESIVGEATLGDLKRRVVIPAVNLTDGSFRIFRSGRETPDEEIKIADVAMASAAAPTYFPVHKIGAELFADGGLIANAPDAIAAQEAMLVMGGKKNYVRMLAVGTTLMPVGTKSKVNQLNWGTQQLIEFTMAGQVSLARHMAMQMLGTDNMMLVDPIRSVNQNKVVGLDKADETAQNTLAAIATATTRKLFEEGSREKSFLERWSNHSVEPL